MPRELHFGEVLEAADQLTPDEQEELIAILHRRLVQAAQQRLAVDISESRREFAQGQCRPATPGEIMREIAQ